VKNKAATASAANEWRRYRLEIKKHMAIL